MIDLILYLNTVLMLHYLETIDTELHVELFELCLVNSKYLINVDAMITLI